jgi:hypothetical protein
MTGTVKGHAGRGGTAEMAADLAKSIQFLFINNLYTTEGKLMRFKNEK